MPATYGLLGPLLEAAEAAMHLSQPRLPTQGVVQQWVNTLMFAAQTQDVPALRVLHRIMGQRMRVFGGDTLTSFADVQELMAREPEKIEWFAGPIDDRADYLTKGYMPFLLDGPNHEMRRKHIVGRIADAHRQLSELDTLLDESPDADHAIVLFLFRHLCSVELDASEVAWFLEYKQLARPLLLLPKVLRHTLLRERHELAQHRRLYFLERIERASQPIADTWFDVIWFNSGTLGFYPAKALQVIDKDPSLRLMIEDEVSWAIEDRLRTRALIHEVVRIYGKIASTNYFEDGKVRIALIPTASVDPQRYQDPFKVDVTRDHSDTVVFAGPAPTRSCPAEHFAPDLMATVLAHSVRSAMSRTRTRESLGGSNAGSPN